MATATRPTNCATSLDLVEIGPLQHESGTGAAGQAGRADRQILTQVSPDSPRLRQLLLRAAMVLSRSSSRTRQKHCPPAPARKGETRHRPTPPAPKPHWPASHACAASTTPPSARSSVACRITRKKGERVSLRHAFVPDRPCLRTACAANLPIAHWHKPAQCRRGRRSRGSAADTPRVCAVELRQRGRSGGLRFTRRRTLS